MPARRLPPIALRALTLVAGCLLVGAGCQTPMWHSSFAPADAPPPAKSEPESKYWSSHSPPAAEAASTPAGAAATRPERPASYESDPTQITQLPALDQTQGADPNNPTGANLVPKLPGSIAENFANNIDPDESMTRGQHFREDLKCLWPEIKGDYANYYSWRNAAMLAVGFGIAAPLANTDVDQKIRDWYQTDVRSSTSDNIAKVAKGFGTGAYVIPGIVAGWVAGEMFYDTTPGNWLDQWGNRTIRAGLVGAPPMLFAQYLTGGSRPSEADAHSSWRPFSDNNGVSGHSFMCGLVFIDAAKMTDEIPMKIGFYALSTMAGWSRVNDDAHYTSQAILGWWMAYCAATAVDYTDKDNGWSVMPMPMQNGAGIAFTYQY